LVLKKYLNIKEDFEVYSSLQAVAKKKGVPLMLPLMDLEDKRELTVDNILSAMPRYALRSDQLRTKAASLILPQMALRLSGIQFLPPERTYSSLQIGKFPFAYRGLKIIPDFQRRPLKFLH
jgi:hypothetical protein